MCLGDKGYISHTAVDLHVGRCWKQIHEFGAEIRIALDAKRSEEAG
jgi:hypothetical protein